MSQKPRITLAGSQNTSRALIKAQLESTWAAIREEGLKLVGAEETDGLMLRQESLKTPPRDAQHREQILDWYERVHATALKLNQLNRKRK